MAALEKLLIRGIRSFDDKQASVIEFYTPVTVIVGHNGSGKTVHLCRFSPLPLDTVSDTCSYGVVVARFNIDYH